MAHYPTAKFLGGVYTHGAAHFDLNFVKLLFLTVIVLSQSILSFSRIIGSHFFSYNSITSDINWMFLAMNQFLMYRLVVIYQLR